MLKWYRLAAQKMSELEELIDSRVRVADEVATALRFIGMPEIVVGVGVDPGAPAQHEGEGKGEEKEVPCVCVYVGRTVRTNTTDTSSTNSSTHKR